MDETSADALLSKLQARGLVEERGAEVGPTRRWNARVQAAAERLNLDAEKHGVPEGNPLVLAVTMALRDEGYLDADFDDAVRVLVTLELSRMSPDKRARYGFDVTL